MKTKNPEVVRGAKQDKGRLRRFEARLPDGSGEIRKRLTEDRFLLKVTDNAGDPIWIGVVAHVFHFITFVAFMGRERLKRMKLHPFDWEFVASVICRKNNLSPGRIVI